MIKNNLARMCGERLIKITDLYKMTGLSRSTLTNLYYRRTKSISFDTLDKLCDALDCNISDLLEKIDD